MHWACRRCRRFQRVSYGGAGAAAGRMSVYGSTQPGCRGADYLVRDDSFVLIFAIHLRWFSAVALFGWDQGRA